MMTRSDLQYRYAWTKYADNDPRVSGPLDTTTINRNEGHEILYFINACALHWGLPSEGKLNYKSMEVIIRELLPPTVFTQREIMEWIDVHYKAYLLQERKAVGA